MQIAAATADGGGERSLKGEKGGGVVWSNSTVGDGLDLSAEKGQLKVGRKKVSINNHLQKFSGPPMLWGTVE